MPTLSVNRRRAGSLALEIAKRRQGRRPNLNGTYFSHFAYGNGIPASNVAHGRAPEHAAGRGRAATWLRTLSSSKWLK